MNGEDGGIVLEAALVLPFFLAFILALISFVRVSIADVTLQTAVSETTKQIATHMYAADVLLQEWNKTGVGQAVNEWIDRIKTAREKIIETEQIVEDYSYFIPEPLLEAARWEQATRTAVEEEANNQLNEAMNKAFGVVLNGYVEQDGNGKKMISSDKVKVLHVTLPDLVNRKSLYFGIEAQYEMTLPIPFFHKVIVLKRQSMERVWVGT